MQQPPSLSGLIRKGEARGVAPEQAVPPVPDAPRPAPPPEPPRPRGTGQRASRTKADSILKPAETEPVRIPLNSRVPQEISVAMDELSHRLGRSKQDLVTAALEMLLERWSEESGTDWHELVAEGQGRG